MLVTCAIITHQNRVLATQRGENMKLPMLWEFPGGKVEEGEHFEDCIVREIREELNVEIELLEKWPNVDHDYGAFQITLIPFLARYISGNIVLSEHNAYRWLTLGELRELSWAPADIPVLEYLLSRLNDGTGNIRTTD